MHPTRRIAAITGALFIAATVAALLAAAFVPVITGGDDLVDLSASADQVTAAALFYLIAAFASAGIAVAMYPVLQGVGAGLALGSVVFRTIEAVMYAVAVVALLSVLALGRQLTTASAADHASLRALGGLLLSLRDHATLVAVFAFSVGALLYYLQFFRSRLVPRWLSGWGIAAAGLMLTACLLPLSSGRPVTGYELLIVPIAAQEMVLAIWLIARGFRSMTAVPSSATPQPVLAAA
jgi:hypothetical protein